MKSHEVTLNRLKKRIGSKIAMIALVAIHDRHLIGIYWVKLPENSLMSNLTPQVWLKFQMLMVSYGLV